MTCWFGGSVRFFERSRLKMTEECFRFSRCSGGCAGAFGLSGMMVKATVLQR